MSSNFVNRGTGERQKERRFSVPFLFWQIPGRRLEHGSRKKRRAWSEAPTLLAGLKHLDECSQMRISIAKKYLSSIHNGRVKLPFTDPHSAHVYHLFPVIVDKWKNGIAKTYAVSKNIFHTVLCVCRCDGRLFVV